MLNLLNILVLVHVFAMLSWLGAMYFNLVLLFPMYQSRGGNGYAELMQTQGTRAAPLLYLLIAFTMSSGLGLAWQSGIGIDNHWAQIKFACLVLMLACHLYGSLVIWPRVFFALDREKPRLFFIYKISMLCSASAGTIAVVLSYLK
ncbi:hypothetical protein [Undibacterium flavidum]|uniref:Protoporphyrinogen IX oxidase n=1 Tax=Undibacterium flavidum TaxID=2762297 RepID=A0ABR6Y9W2_9BURK|nr:hypothetical protein [Undibacterium flavidum]MBC3873438.1 hypothetical protein [Undibacterium flavidum]